MKNLFTFCLGLLSVSFAFSQLSALEKGFIDPPVSARPKALWPWVNGNTDLSQITFELEEAKRKGMGGFDIWDIGAMVDPDHVIPPGPAFLSDSSLAAIAHTIREADRLNLEIGLTFSSSWNAGGSWVNPEHGAMGLFRSDTILQGPQQFSSTLRFPRIPETYHGQPNLVTRFKDPVSGLPVYYKEVAVLAHPYTPDSTIASVKNIINLEKSYEGSGQLQWTVPAGTWRVIRYVCVPTGQPLAIPSTNSNGLMLDHFSAAAQKANLDFIFKKLLGVTGPLKNRSLKYLYGDSYEVNSAVWTPLLPEEFIKQNRYDIRPYLPLLDGFRLHDKDSAARFNFDFNKTLSNLIIENHYALARKICEKHGIGFCAEAGGPGQPIHNVPFEDLKALGALTIPRGEFWNKHPQLEILQIVKGIASASHIYNQRYVEAESFTSVWLWQEGPDELKPLADRAMCEGLNRFVYHTFPHTPRRSGFPGWVYNFGTLINTTNGWWPKSKHFHDYLARSSYLLQQGNFVGDVAFYYGDAAPNFVPPKHVVKSLGMGYDYDVVNSDAILHKMQVKNGRIYLPHGQYYEVLVLPDEASINTDVLQKLQLLVQQGATIIGRKPERAHGLYNNKDNDQLVTKLSGALWGKVDSINVKQHRYGKGQVIWGKTIREVLGGKGIIPDMEVHQSGSPNTLDFIHRRTTKEDIYFVRNVRNEAFNGEVSFRVSDRIPEIWDPETGNTFPVRFYSIAKGIITIPLSFHAKGSCFVVFRQGLPKKPKENLTVNNTRLIDVKKEHAILSYHKSGLIVPAGKWSWQSGKGMSIKNWDVTPPVLLNKPWTVNFSNEFDTLPLLTMPKLIPLNESQDEKVKHFSGTISYHQVFQFEKPPAKNHVIILQLGGVKEIAEVTLNGKSIGTSWHQPYELDITEAIKVGDNKLVIEVVNTINNRLVGDAKKPSGERKMRSNITKLPNAWNKPFAEAPLLGAGLIGPVQIITRYILE